MRTLLSLACLSGLVTGCGSDDNGVGDGTECASCKSDADCGGKMTCEGFYNKAGVSMRCSRQCCNLIGCVPCTASCGGE